MKQKEIFEAIRAAGCTVGKRDGIFRVCPRGADEDQAYYTDDPADALWTAKSMNKEKAEMGECLSPSLDAAHKALIDTRGNLGEHIADITNALNDAKQAAHNIEDFDEEDRALNGQMAIGYEAQLKALRKAYGALDIADRALVAANRLDRNQQ